MGRRDPVLPRRRPTAAAAVFGIILSAGVVAERSPASATYINYHNFPENCSHQTWVGPNGWRHMEATCTAPLQAQNKMFRIKVDLEEFSPPVGYDQRRGNWVDCNGNESTVDDWIDANWTFVEVWLVYADDAKEGGC